MNDDELYNQALNTSVEIVAVFDELSRALLLGRKYKARMLIIRGEYLLEKMGELVRISKLDDDERSELSGQLMQLEGFIHSFKQLT